MENTQRNMFIKKISFEFFFFEFFFSENIEKNTLTPFFRSVNTFVQNVTP